MLKRGIAVLRPDYEGIGGGPESQDRPHPYLIAPSLAESMLAIMRARRSIDERLGNGWVCLLYTSRCV